MKNAISKVSIIIPVYNEVDNLLELHAAVVRNLSILPYAWELLLVDDGSFDGSRVIIQDLALKDPHVKFVSFEKNCGQSAAFAAGFRYASGDVVVTMDADLQNDPADIPAMLEIYVQGVDMVIGWRAKRRDSLVKRCASRFANWVRNKVSHETVRDTGCSLKVMRTAMLRSVPMFTGMHRFLPTLMKLEGATVAEVRVNHRPRSKGRSKYGVLDRAWASTYDLFAVRWMQKRHISYRISDTNIQ